MKRRKAANKKEKRELIVEKTCKNATPQTPHKNLDLDYKKRGTVTWTTKKRGTVTWTTKKGYSNLDYKKGVQQPGLQEKGHSNLDYKKNGTETSTTRGTVTWTTRKGAQ